jgi:DNA mismatch repair protein MutS2
MFDDIIDFSKLPTIDLHGEFGDFARIRVNEFINDNIKLKNKYIAIIHGKGTGVVKKVVIETLKNSKNVEEYKICIFNDGMTIAKLRR